MQESMAAQIVKVDPEFEIYRIGRKIGYGTHGHVYRGYDKLNGRIVALKYVQNNKTQTWRKEVKALQQFDHPNIIKYYQYIPQKAENSDKIIAVCIVTEFVRGQTLQEFIQSNSKINQKGLSEATVLKIFSQLLEGFNHIHSEGFVHRDIKPQNILIDQDQNVKIIDLGQSNQRKLIKTKGLGTPLYSPPQSFTGGNFKDFRVDVWSLGLVLYEMVTGRCYFEEWKQCNDEQKFRNFLLTHKIKVNFPRHFSPFWATTCKRMLEKNYNLRVNLHDVIFEFKHHLPEIKSKLKDIGKGEFFISNISMTGASINSNPLVQSQNEFEFSRTKKYLTFFRNKHKLIVLLGDLLSKFKYPFLSNSHKLILLFLSLNIYVAAIDHLLKRLDKTKIIITQNQKFDVSQFQQPYRSAMMEYMGAYRDYYEKQCRYTKNTILQKIIPKFVNITCSKSTSSETESLDSGSTTPMHPSELLDRYQKIRSLIQDFKQGRNYSKSYYLGLFKWLVFSEEYYHSGENIRQYFYEEDMAIYYLMLIIANLDSMLSWGHDYLGDQIPKLHEELLVQNRGSSGIQSLLTKISKLNLETSD